MHTGCELRAAQRLRPAPRLMRAAVVPPAARGRVWSRPPACGWVGAVACGDTCDAANLMLSSQFKWHTRGVAVPATQNKSASSQPGNAIVVMVQ